jgi:hypothetical protein
MANRFQVFTLQRFNALTAIHDCNIGGQILPNPSDCAVRRRDHLARLKLVLKPKGASRWPLLSRDDLMNRSTAASNQY